MQWYSERSSPDSIFKLGPLELPEAKRAVAASEEALDAIQGDLASNVESTREAMTVAADAAEGVVGLTEEIDDLRRTIAVLVGLLETPSEPSDKPDDDTGSPA